MISTSSGSSRRFEWTSPQLFCSALLYTLLRSAPLPSPPLSSTLLYFPQRYSTLFPLLRSTLLYSNPKSPYIGSFSTKLPLQEEGQNSPEIPWAQLPVSGDFDFLLTFDSFQLGVVAWIYCGYLFCIRCLFFGQCLYLWLMTYDFWCLLYLCLCAVVFFVLRNFCSVNCMGGSMINWMGWNHSTISLF